MNIFFLVYAVFSFGMAGQAWTDYNTTAVLGWLAAIIPATILCLQDLFDKRTEEQDILEKKRLDAFENLMNAGSKDVAKL